MFSEKIDPLKIRFTTETQSTQRSGFLSRPGDDGRDKDLGPSGGL